jgi:hypothetical protein
MTWNDRFTELFSRSLESYRSGDTDFKNHYSSEDIEFLESIGYQPRELFDFVEDLAEEGEPSASTALLVAAVRRDYFLTLQKGEKSDKVLTRDDVPGFGEEFEGIPYFPRILEKAKAKLRGELDPDLMFGCGGDRNFLQKNGNIHPADFLRHVWAIGDEPEKLAAWVKQQRA